MRSFVVERTFEGEHIQNVFKVVLDGVKMSDELVNLFVTNVYYSLRHNVDGDVDLANCLQNWWMICERLWPKSKNFFLQKPNSGLPN